MSEQQKNRSNSVVRMKQRAVQETSVKDLISKYNTAKSANAPKLRRFRRKGGRKGAKRRGSQLIAVPTAATQNDAEVTSSKSQAEQDILLRLEKQQADFERMLEEQRAEKEALAARLSAAERNLEQASSMSQIQIKTAERERARLEQLVQQQQEQHKEEVSAATEVEKDIEAHYGQAVKVRRASAALVGKALLGGALSGAAQVDLPEEVDTMVAAAPSPQRQDNPPEIPTRAKPQKPESSDSSSSSSSPSTSSDEDAQDSDAPDDAYEENIDEIINKPLEECTPIEKAARRSAMSEVPIPALVDIIPDVNQDSERLYEFLHSPVPYEQGIIQCELHRKGKSYYFYLSSSDENDTIFLMFAQDRSGFGAVNLMLSMIANGKRNDPYFLGKVRGNVLNTKYVLFDRGEHPHAKHNPTAFREEKGFVNYTLYEDAPRKMTVVVPKVADDGTVLRYQQSMESQDMLEKKYTQADEEGVEFSENKQPKWDRRRKCFVLDFKKRATEASVKNFLLVTKEDPDHDSVLFGKRGRDEFNVDVQFPMSFFQAFAICLTAVYSKSAPSM